MRFLQSVFYAVAFILVFSAHQVVFAQEGELEEQPALLQYQIGIVTDGPINIIPDFVSIFKDELLNMAEGEFSISFPDDMLLQADSTRESVRQRLVQLLQNPETDLVLALGTIGSTEALKFTELNKPVVAPFIFDAEWQKAPLTDGGSGRDNLYYIDLQTTIDQQLIDFHKLVPFKKLGLVLDERDIDGVPAFKRLASYLSNEHSISVQLIPAGNSVQKILAEIDDDVQALMVGVLWQFSPDQLKQLSQGLIDKKIATFSLAIYDYVEKGFFATTMPEKAVDQLARQVAINVQEILLGEDPTNLSVVFSKSQKLAINMETARNIGVYPSLDYMTGAILINEERKDIQRRITLPEAVAEAIAANLDLEVARREVSAGSFSVDEARSSLLPQLFIGAGGSVIDDDRAAIGGGTAPEQALTGSLTGALSIYTEDSWANYTVEKYLQEGREFDRNRIELDIILEVSTAYLNVLRSETIERIQKENMRLTQANLDRAQIRLSTGVAGPDELYRWQTEFANDRQIVLSAESSTRDAKQRLNRILHRPLREEFIAQETDFSNPLLIGGDELFYELIHNPLYFEKFNVFALDKGIEFSPELKFLDSAILAQERLLLKAEREYYVPDVTIEGDLSYLFVDGGEGTRDEDFNGLDDTDWQVGVFARLPLYEGGRRSAAKSRNLEQLLQLQTERLATEERVSQRILNELNNTRASYPSINLSRDAVDAARRNLQLVTDSYVEGIKSIIDLLDAQNQALRAELDAANAVYDFLIDLMGVQRSIGIFTTFLPLEERQEWVDRVKQFLEQQ